MVTKPVLKFVFALMLLTPLAAEAGVRGVDYTPQSVKAAADRGCSVLLAFNTEW